MKILAIDSSGTVASVAIVQDDSLIAEYSVNYKKTHSQTLLPMIDEISRMVELDRESIDAIAVAAGPGSFTGLRIGSATAKGLAQAMGRPIVAVPTVDALAYNLYGSNQLICPLMDARRNQTYTGIYEFVKNENGTYDMRTVLKQCAVDVQEVIDTLNEIGREVVFLGDGVPVFSEQIERELKVPYTYAPAFMNRQRAAALAALSMRYMDRGEMVTAASYAPIYLRLSQAEREQLEKESLENKAD